MSPSLHRHLSAFAGKGQVVNLPLPALKAARERALLSGFCVVAAGFRPAASGQFQCEREPVHAATFIYCVKGGGWFEAEGRLHTVRQGDLLILPPDAPYVCGAHASNPWTIHWARATGGLLAHYLRELAVGAHEPVIHVGEDPQMIRLFNEILLSLQRGTAYVFLLQASHALAYLLALLIEKRQASPPAEPDAARKVADSIIYMSEHLDEPLRVSALARLASLSPAYFGELFKNQTGCSPRDYLHLLRIHRACRLLDSTTLSVKQIATQLGYQDQFHFSRQFKAFQKMSPSEYRGSRPSRIANS